MLNKGRLTKLIKPINYKIELFPNFETFTFDGKVTIQILFDKKYKTIPKFAIHSKQLKNHEIKFNNIEITKSNFELDEENELIIINPINITNGETNILEISYIGILNDDLKGFYRSKYVKNGVEYWIATTQFESTDARRAFPCFDEPNFKATFDISIKHQMNKMVLSNMSIEQTTSLTNDKLILTQFKTTPIMSSYLVAFIVADTNTFINTSGFSLSNKKVTIYSLPEEESKLNFTLDVAIKSLNWFENWFNIDYPIEKMDLIGIPDFNAGAMENWGLITFRPTHLFCSENDLLDDKVSVVTTIAHEIAHQWFGNLVTMEWWNYLWLNESMATYFGWLVCHELFQDWSVWDKFIDDEYSYALELDSLESSHPIEFDEEIVKSAKDIDQIFDGISYSKGSCIVRSLVKQIGENNFRRGMQIYMTDNKYSNTTSNDLWNSFDKAINNNNSNISVSNLMNSWTRQTGYPLIEVTCDINCKCTKLTQQRFLKRGQNNDKTLWKVPITFSGSCESVSLIMDKKNEQYPLDCNICKFIVNPERYDFYRVKYNAINSDGLPFEINSLSASSQKQILSDMFSLALSGYQSFDLVFDTLQQIKLKDQTSSVLWSVILKNMTTIYELLKNHEEKQIQIKKFIEANILSHVQNLLYKIGFDDKEDDTINELDLRPLLIDFLGAMDDITIINHAKNNFANGKYHYYLWIVAKNANLEEFIKLIKMFDDESLDTNVKSNLIKSIGCVKESIFIKIVIKYILAYKIRDQDVDTLIARLSANKYATRQMWKYAKKNWGKNIFDLNSSSMTHTIKYIGLGFCSEKELNKYTKFFKKVGIPKGTQMVYNQTIEKIETKILAINRLLNLVI